MVAAPDPDRQCRALTRSGARCTRWAVQGRNTCNLHGRTNLTVEAPASGNGKVNQARAEVAKVATAHLAQVIGSTQHDPTEVLREAVDLTRSLAHRIGEMADRPDVEDKDFVSILRLYRETLVSLADVCKKDLDAGVAKRRLQLDEGYARVAFDAFIRTLDIFYGNNESAKAQLRLEYGRQLQLEGARA